MVVMDWKAFLIPYEQAVEELKVKFRNLRDDFKHRDEYSPIEFVTGRVKKVSSILDKAKFLGVSLDHLSEGIEDIAGIRIMCQFVEDISRVVELIKQREGQDMTIVYEKDYITNTKISGYRSYHMIVRYPVQTSRGRVDVLTEIQIRTLAMNFWATIEHSLHYKYKENIPETIRERLRKAAEASYHLDEEMSQIRNEIKEAQRMFEEKSNVVHQILSDIHQLYYLGRSDDAMDYQKKFNEVWDEEGTTGLQTLALDIRRCVSQFGGHFD
jgi:putative GTP pyrophosphokinase